MSTIVEDASEVSQRFRRLADLTPMLVWMSDTTKKCVYVNQQWISFTGHALSELVGDGWLEDVHPDDRARCMENYQRAFDSRQKFTMEYRLRRGDGQYRHVMDIGVPEYSVDGVFLGYVGTVVDMDGQKKAEEALRQSEVRCRAVFSSLVGHVAVIDRKGIIIGVNDAWLRFARQHRARVETVSQGVNYLEICRQAMAREEHEAGVALSGIQAVLEGIRSEFTLEYRCPAKSGDRWFEMIVHPLRRPEGGAIITHLNITKRRRAELEAQCLLQELAHVTRVTLMGELTASFAHELSQPLTAILNNAQVAQRWIADQPKNPDRIQEILSDIVTDNLRAAKVIHQLRNMLKKGIVDFKNLNLNKLIQDVVELLKDEAILKRVRVSLDLDPALPGVRGDRIQLQQVVLNLMVNAFEAMQNVQTTQRMLLIRTSQSAKNEVFVIVQDAGPGLAPGKPDRVFEPFFSTKLEGMGMGLAICRSIVRAHQGEISAMNNPHQGATFKVRLPVFQQHEA
jgi:two-component system sensor kinase FixL